MAKYHMHRKEREITDRDELVRILNNGRYAVISMCRENEPYVVALSYGYVSSENVLYSHCSLKGLKLEFIEANSNVCAMVIEDLEYKPGECSHEYKSVVMWGKMSIIKDPVQKKHGLDIILNHLEENPGLIKDKHLNNELVFEKLAVLKLEITEMTGKRGR